MSKRVDFNTAVMLKEAGYDVPTLSCYHGDNGGIENTLNELRNHNSSPLRRSAPELHEVTEWLREVKGLHVAAELADVLCDETLWVACRYDLKENKLLRRKVVRDVNNHFVYFPDHDTALTAAIIHCITIINERK